MVAVHRRSGPHARLARAAEAASTHGAEEAGEDVEEIARDDIPGQGGNPAAPARSGEGRAVLADRRGVRDLLVVLGLPFAKEFLSNMWVRSLSEGVMYHLDHPIQDAGPAVENGVGGLVDVAAGASLVGKMAVPGRPAQARAADAVLLTLLAAAAAAAAATGTYAASTPPALRTTVPQIGRAALESLVGMETNLGTPTALEQSRSSAFTGLVAVPLTGLLVLALGSETFHSSTSSLVRGQSTGGIAGSFAGYGIGLGVYEAVLFLCVMAFNAHTIGVDVPTNRTLPDGTLARDADGNPETRRVRGAEGLKNLRVGFKGPPKDEHGNRTFKALRDKFLERLAGPTPARFGGNAIFARTGAAASTIGGEAFQNTGYGQVTLIALLAVLGGALEWAGSSQDVPKGGFAPAPTGPAGGDLEMQRPSRQAPALADAGRGELQRVHGALETMLDDGLDDWTGPLAQAMASAFDLDAGGPARAARPFDPSASETGPSEPQPPQVAGLSVVRSAARRPPPTGAEAPGGQVDAGA